MRCPITGIWLRPKTKARTKALLCGQAGTVSTCSPDSKRSSGNWTAPLSHAEPSCIGVTAPWAHWLWGGERGQACLCWQEDLSSLGHWKCGSYSTETGGQVPCPGTVTCQRLGSQGLERDTARAQTHQGLFSFLKIHFKECEKIQSFLR